MKNSKKIISLALCLALTLSMFVCLGTVTTFAASEAAGHRELNGTGYGLYWYSDTLTKNPYSSGSGTQADPYIVETAAQLRVLVQGGGSGASNTTGKYYKLGNDIVLNDTSREDWYEGDGLTNWIKGTDAAYGVFSDTRNSRELSADLFRGNFDGDGHTISGLYINYAGTGHMDESGETKRTAVGWALFPSVNGAKFSNLKLKDVYIKSNVSKSSGTQPHGYGALIGYCYYEGATVNNVQIENVKFDLQSPNQASVANRIGVGSIIGYAGGTITATDCIVKNISGKAVNKYFTSSGKPGSAGSIIGFVDGAGGYKHTLTNVISIGRMNPLSAGVADPAFVTTNTDTAIPLSMPIRSGSSATNVYAIGDVAILTGCGITKAVDEATFINNYLDTFYASIGASTNWAAKEAGKLPTLKSFPYVEEHKEKAAVLHCDFSVYDTTTVRNVNIDHNPWSIATTGGNKYLKGDFNTAGLIRSSYGFILPNNTASYEYGVDGPMVPGKIYKLEFKAKADNKADIYYALYNGSTGTASSVANHVTDDVYDDFGKRRAVVTTEWQTFTTYLTFESYINTVDSQQGTERPYFFVYPRQGVWNNVLYFDDFVITPCDGVSFAAAEDKYYQPTVGEIGDDITLIGDPEKQDWIFDGWYKDAELQTPLEGTEKIGDVDILYEKFEEAATDMSYDPITVEETGNGIYTENLYTKVTSANAYPINLDLVNNGSGNAVLGFATASEDDFTVANSVIWQKDITGKSGKVAVLLKPNTLKENGVKGDMLYLFVKYEDGADISITDFAMIDAPKSRSVEFDVNSDNSADILDLIKLKKVAAGQTEDINWLVDINGDGFAATAEDLVVLKEAILGISHIETEKYGRTLVWNDEFDGTSLNSDTFAIKYSMDDDSLIGSEESDNFNVSDGKLNLNVTRVNGTDYKVPFEVMTRNKMSFNKGYIEMSAKVNLSGGQLASYWLSAWLDENEGEHKGEIDIFETTGSAFKPNVHSWSSDGKRLAQLGDTVIRFAIDDNFDTNAYHTYGLEWDDDYLKFYVDGYNYYTVATSSLGDKYNGILEQNYYLLFGNIVYTNQDGGINFDNALPRMSIDYVRLYQKSGETIHIGTAE